MLLTSFISFDMVPIYMHKRPTTYYTFRYI